MAKFKPQNKDALQALVNDESVYLGDIDTSEITDMSFLFKSSQRRDFKGIETWDTSNVVDMTRMFNGAENFNQPLNSWNTSKVTNMDSVFHCATSFNQPLDKWDTSNVTNMVTMFFGARSFNQPLNSWNTSKVTNMGSMFSEATSFNQALDKWDVSKVTDMGSMFSEATSFNQPLNSWNTSKVEYMQYMFSGATSFNQNMNSWRLTENKWNYIFENSPLQGKYLAQQKEELEKEEFKDYVGNEKSLLSKVIIGFVLVLIVIYVFSGTDESPQNEVVENSQPKAQSTTQKSEKRVFENSQRANVENKPNLQSELKTQSKTKDEPSPQNELNAASEAKNEAQAQSETTSKITNEPTQSVKPSFDCNKASTTTERLVCSDDELASLDLQLANAYKNARNSADIAGKKKILNEQKIWLKAYNLCNDKDCVKQNLEQRIKDLNQMSGVR